MSDEKRHDAPLTVLIENDQLVIRIGIGTLAYCAERMESNNPYDGDRQEWIQQCAISDAFEFAKDVKSQMNEEAENGDTPLCLFLDKMCDAAIEDGSMGTRDTTPEEKASSIYDRDLKEQHNIKDPQ